jgi:hypothetical protein
MMRSRRYRPEDSWRSSPAELIGAIKASKMAACKTAPSFHHVDYYRKEMAPARIANRKMRFYRAIRDGCCNPVTVGDFLPRSRATRGYL